MLEKVQSYIPGRWDDTVKIDAVFVKKVCEEAAILDDSEYAEFKEKLIRIIEDTHTVSTSLAVGRKGYISASKMKEAVNEMMGLLDVSQGEAIKIGVQNQSEIQRLFGIIVREGR